MRDTILNTTAWIIATIVIGLMLYGTLSLGKSFHAAEACMEDEAWITVDYDTPGAFEDSHGVTRACINIDEIGEQSNG